MGTRHGGREIVCGSRQVIPSLSSRLLMLIIVYDSLIYPPEKTTPKYRSIRSPSRQRTNESSNIMALLRRLDSCRMQQVMLVQLDLGSRSQRKEQVTILDWLRVDNRLTDL
jgi:hypothetical protein